MDPPVKSFAFATTACAVAALVLMPSSSTTGSAGDERPGGRQPSVESSAALHDASVRQVEAGQTVRVDGRVAKRLARGTATLSRVGNGTRQRIDTSRVDARRRYTLKGAAPLRVGRYSYEVTVRLKGTARTIKRFKVVVVGTPTSTPTPTPVTTGPQGDANDWTYLGGSRVARWDPCNSITWSVTGASPYADAQADLATSFARISAATGLSFVQVTDPAASTFDVAWTNAAAEPRLAGSVVGLGGFTSYSQLVGPSEVVSGYVLLDNEHALSGGFSSLGASWGKVMMHEMSHAVGLGHAAGAEQIMYPTVVPSPAEFGAGDLTGLTAVGAAQGCFPAEPVAGRKVSRTVWK